VKAVSDAGKKAKAASMLNSIINFAKYHFQDNSIYVDNSPITSIDPSTGETVHSKTFTTAVLDENTNRFFELKVERDGNTFTIQDDISEQPSRVVVTGEENKDWNIMCRDNVYTSGGKGPSATLNNYSSSSYTVLQPIDKALLNRSMFGYDGLFKRFADNGATVDTMYVDGEGSVTVDDRNYYLIAKRGNIRLSDPRDGVQEVHKAGYLMQPIAEGESDEYDALLTREKLITERKAVDGVYKNLEILVTDEGYGVKEIKDSKGVVTSFEYDTVEKDGIIYIKKYNNDGTVKEEIEVGVVTPEEGEDNN
jgi:hypothetical protein